MLLIVLLRENPPCPCCNSRKKGNNKESYIVFSKSKYSLSHTHVCVYARASKTVAVGYPKRQMIQRSLTLSLSINGSFFLATVVGPTRCCTPRKKKDAFATIYVGWETDQQQLPLPQGCFNSQSVSLGNLSVQRTMCHAPTRRTWPND